ncbi:MAG: hypothetical protein ABI346_01830 [Candidatus Baltobacteraceae bacterium]
MSIYRVIDKLETYVTEGTWLPFGMRILSEERLIEFIEKMRSTLPEEVGRAKVIATNKERVIREAQEKAQLIVTEATQAHSQLVEQSEIVRQARMTADVVLREAEERARKVREGADQYAGRVLTELEARLATALGSVRKGQDALTAAQARVAAPAAGQLADDAAKSKRVAFDAQNDTLEIPPVEVTS